MKKIMCVVLAAAMAAAAFAGCSSGGSAGGESQAAPSETGEGSAPVGSEADSPAGSGEAVNLKWALWDLDLTTYYKPLAEAYKAKNPNVNIEFVDLGSADFMTMLGTQLSGGADLDILSIKDIPGYSNLVRQNFLEPLNSYIEQEGIDTSVYGGTAEQLTVNDNLYTLPFRKDFWVVYYNKDLFDKAGVEYPTNDMTLDEYDALARKMTSGEGAEKVYGNHYHTWRSTVQLFGILDEQHTIVDGTYEFLRPYYDRVLSEQADGICQDYATLKTSSTHYSSVFFNNQVAMMNMGTWFIATQIEKVKTGESLSGNWGMVKYPHPDGVAAGTTVGTITGLSVNSKSAHKAEALDFVKFVSGAEGAKIVADTGTLPAIMNEEIMNAISSMEGYPTDENSKEALNTVKICLEMPLHEKISDIEVILNECHDSIMTKNVDLDQGLKDMDTRVQEILNAG